MKRIIFTLSLLGCGAIILSSCHSSNSLNPDAEALKALRNQLKTPSQKILINAGRDTFVTAENGTGLTFHSNSFATLDGTPITSGIVAVELVEMIRKRYVGR